MPVHIWTCSRCYGSVCEMTTEDEVKPRHCPCNLIASWKLDNVREEGQ